MTKPRPYLKRIFLFLGAVAILCMVLALPLKEAFLANVALNGLILAVLLLGIIYIVRQILMLTPEIEWLNAYRRTDRSVEDREAPTLLGPMATMLAEHPERLSLSTLSMRSLLDSIAARLDEGREISRYAISLLIFLGLLGTFWGLLNTIGSIGNTIESLTMTSTNFAIMFDELKAGLREPLSGMGTAFSSSLFGLSGSVVLGFLDLQAGQAQNRFYNDLEEWLSSITTLSGGSPRLGDGEHGVPAYVSALLERTAESLDNLQRSFTRSEESRETTNHALLALSERLADLADLMRENQETAGIDEASKQHLRNLDVHVGQLSQHIAANRTQLVDELRGEFKLLARTIGTALESKNRD